MTGADPPLLEHLTSVPLRQGSVAAAVDIPGVGLDGEVRTVHVARLARWSLLLFLAARCDGCRPFWDAAAAPSALGMAAGEHVVSVTHEPPLEDAEEIRSLLAGRPGVASAVVMSDAAWPAYGVLGPPFFVLVDGERVVSEGVAWSVAQVAADVGRARRAR
jgi:hypothetical protein